MKIASFVLRNKVTLEEYAYHISDGETLRKWKREIEKELNVECEIVKENEE